MIGKELKKLAVQNGMTVSNGMAYGNFHGYAVTLYDTYKFEAKVLGITAYLNNRSIAEALQRELEAKNLSKEFQIQEYEFTQNSILFVFRNNSGSMKKMQAFTDWFFPLLDQYQVPGCDCCAQCGGALSSNNETWVLVNNSVTYHLHEGCTRQMQENALAEQQREKEESTDTYASGFAGALLGAIPGGILWGIVLYLGYFASVIGFLIGIWAEKGYRLLHGKKGKGKIVVVFLVSLLAMAAGTFISEAIVVGTMIQSGELELLAYSDIPRFLIDVFRDDPEYRQYILSTLGQGLLFLMLGIVGILLRSYEELKGFHMKKIK